MIKERLGITMLLVGLLFAFGISLVVVDEQMKGSGPDTNDSARMDHV
ncbi:MAG: hypothetical protein SCALA701_00230 [Candidatus Scalindua sp.]|nr:hypothetical protein [Planctomycetota bacterium]GJQ57222.1 MAG: hypothetical protein SCALA701_00230 [Candidatus Scalindua sp.]